MELYRDEFTVIGITADGNTAYYADYAMTYFEFSVSVAKFIVKKLKQSVEQGYNLIDYICRKRIKLKGENKNGFNL